MSSFSQALDSGPTIVAEAYCPSCETSYPEALDSCPADSTRLVRLRASQRGSLLGKIVDKYRLVELIGCGGMGTIYRAESFHGPDVAIKVVNRDREGEISSAKRFLREAKLASRLDHPNTVRVIDFGQTADGMLFLVMELVDGRTLDQILAIETSLSPRRTCVIGSQLLAGLDNAHRHGILHRDLKPGNVMVSAANCVKVLDFGLARSLESASICSQGYVLGTPQYLAPESILNRHVGPAADLYAVGVVLYECLSGKPPFWTGEQASILLSHVERSPAPLPRTIPSELAAVVMRLLAKDPAHRFPSARVAAMALENALPSARYSMVEFDTCGSPSAARTKMPG